MYMYITYFPRSLLLSIFLEPTCSFLALTAICAAWNVLEIPVFMVTVSVVTFTINKRANGA